MIIINYRGATSGYFYLDFSILGAYGELNLNLSQACTMCTHIVKLIEIELYCTFFYIKSEAFLDLAASAFEKFTNGPQPHHSTAAARPKLIVFNGFFN